VFKTLNLDENHLKNLVKDIDQNGDGEVLIFITIFSIYVLKNKDLIERIH